MNPERKLLIEFAGIVSEILRHDIANLGTKSEFFKCYTYPPHELPGWVGRAKNALKKAERINNGNKS